MFSRGVAGVAVFATIALLVCPAGALQPSRSQPSTLDPRASHALDGSVMAEQGTRPSSSSLEPEQHNRAVPSPLIPTSSARPLGLDTVGRISHVQGPSNSGIVTANWVVLALAICLFTFELACPQQPWSEALKRSRKGRSICSDPCSSASAPALDEERKEESREDRKEENLEVPEDGLQQKKYTILIFGCVGVAACDLYYNMPGTFIVGELQRRGISAGIGGLYIGGGGILSVPMVLFFPWLAGIMSATDMARISSAMFMVFSCAQGLANLLPNEGFIAVLMGPRLLEGLPLAVMETTAQVLMNTAFPVDELGNAMAILSTVRGSLIACSAPLGGSLYDAGGFSLPYAVAGAIGCVAIVAMRLLLQRSYNTPQSPTSLITIVKNPGAMAAFFSFFTGLYIFAGMDTIWQCWLGTTPYGWNPARISTVPMTMAVANVVLVPLLGMPFAHVFGDGVAMLVGLPLQFFPLPLVMGPWLFPSLAHAPPAWVPYVAAGIAAAGSSIAAIPMWSLPMKVMVHAGFSPEQVATPVGVMSMILAMLGNVVGPLINGLVVDAFGVSAVAMIQLGIGTLAIVLTMSFNWQVLFSKETSKAEPDEAEENVRH